tara:strand:+ start:318 stop:695 length:378 start_codon:yes stop_codon:yes gene_type:complete
MCLFHRQHEDTPVIQRIISTTAEGKGMDSLIANTAPAGLVPNDDEDTDVDDAACGTGEDAGAKSSASAKKKAAWTEDEKKMKTETKKGKAGKKIKEWPVHLFCRMEGCEYVYCGRLRAMEYDPRK